MRLTILLLSYIFFSSAVCRADDELVSVDAAEGMITIQQRGALKTYRLKPFTYITINGQKAAAGQLRAGMQVTLGLADGQTASYFQCRSPMCPYRVIALLGESAEN